MQSAFNGISLCIDQLCLLDLPLFPIPLGYKCISNCHVSMEGATQRTRSGPNRPAAAIGGGQFLTYSCFLPLETRWWKKIKNILQCFQGKYQTCGALCAAGKKQYIYYVKAMKQYLSG